MRPRSDFSQPAVMVHPRAPVKVRGVHVSWIYKLNKQREKLNADRKRRASEPKISNRKHRRIRELEYEAEKLRLEAQLDIPTKGKGDQEIIESRLRDFEDAEEENVYRDIKPQISENVENREIQMSLYLSKM